MKQKKLFMVLLAVMCLFAFAACGGAEFDPIAYVQGSFDAVFHGTVTDEFIATLDDVDSAEAYKTEYDDMLASVTETTLTSMGITEPTESLTADTKAAFVSIFDASKYEISNEYIENEDGSFDVEVTVYPLLTYMEVCNDSDGSLTAAAETKVTADMSYEEIMTVVIEEMIAKLNTEMQNPAYGDPQTCTIHVYLDDNGYYIVDEDEISEITMILMGTE